MRAGLIVAAKKKPFHQTLDGVVRVFTSGQASLWVVASLAVLCSTTLPSEG